MALPPARLLRALAGQYQEVNDISLLSEGVFFRVPRDGDDLRECYVVLVTCNDRADPILLRLRFPDAYPFRPLHAEVLTQVASPLVTPEGRVDFDASDLSPVYRMHHMGLIFQTVMTHPGFWSLEPCRHSLDWESRVPRTAAVYHGMLVESLIYAAYTETSDKLFYAWRFLKGLRNLLSLHPLAYSSRRDQWYMFLSHLAAKRREVAPQLTRLESQEHTFPRSCALEWGRESRALLEAYFRLDGLRNLLGLQARGNNLGSLQPVVRLLHYIRTFVSDASDEQLFPGNSLLQMSVRSISRVVGTSGS